MAINYKDIEIAFDFVSCVRPYENEAYINIQTGETYWYSLTGDNTEELPADIDDESKFIALPHKIDLNLGKNLALDFAYQYLPEEAEKLSQFFRHEKAFSKFKSILENHDMIDKWLEYERKAQEHALREWGQSNGIEFID